MLKGFKLENIFAAYFTVLRIALGVSDPGGLEICCHGDRQTTAVHLFPGDASWNYRNTDGRASHIRICRPGPNNRDLSREMRIRGDELLWDSIIY